MKVGRGESVLRRGLPDPAVTACAFRIRAAFLWGRRTSVERIILEHWGSTGSIAAVTGKHPSFDGRSGMRRFFLMIVLGLMQGTAMAAGVQSALHDRCLASIETSGQQANRKTLKETMTVPMGENFLFQFTDPAGGVFTCQICDDANPAVHSCGSIGLDLSYRAKDAEMQRLPAELDKKCVYYLQKELKPRKQEEFINHDLVGRISVTPDHTEKSWMFRMEVDGGEYRCVIRKNDGNFRVESKKGNDWRPIAAGSMF